jgi:hypothetical protein
LRSWVQTGRAGIKGSRGSTAFTTLDRTSISIVLSVTRSATVQVSGGGVADAVSSATSDAIYSTMTVDENAAPGGRTVTVVSNGNGGNGFFPAPGGGASVNANLQVREITLPSMTPTLSMSTGGSASVRTIGGNFAPSDVSVGLRFSVTAQATLSVPERTGNGTVTATVKAGPSGSSEVFAVRAETPSVRIEPPAFSQTDVKCPCRRSRDGRIQKLRSVSQDEILATHTPGEAHRERLSL